MDPGDYEHIEALLQRLLDAPSRERNKPENRKKLAWARLKQAEWLELPTDHPPVIPATWKEMRRQHLSLEDGWELLRRTKEQLGL
ncbi:MAG TPA: hypothetical protein VGG62_10655 [Terracidiphilus sp.]|jgi:hypothetical protein